MKRVTAVLIVLISGMTLSVRSGFAQEAEVRAAVLESLAAWKEGNVEAFAQFFGPDSRGFNLDGGLLIQGFNPAALQAALAAGLGIDVEPRDVDVKVYGNAAIVVAYLVGSISLPGGVTHEGTWRYSETRVRNGDVWKVVQYHISPLTVQLPEPER